MFLLIIALSLSITEYAYVKNTQQNYIEKLNKAEGYFSDKEFSDTKKLSEQIKSEWANTKEILNIFLIQDKVEDISENIENLCEYAQNEKSDEYIWECKKIKRQLLSITESELPYLENLL